jgi:uncharacterized protein (DUF488 family)
MNFFTMGYGGRTREGFLEVLRENGVKVAVDVRIEPHRAYRGYFAKAKSSDKGIEGLLARAGIRYRSFVKLGNPYRDEDDWQTLYRQYLETLDTAWIEELRRLEENFCLLCAEKDFERCHRKIITEHLVKVGFMLVKHL